MALPPADVWRRRFDEWSGSVSRLLYPDVLAERFGSDHDRGSVDPTAASLTPILARLDGAESGETKQTVPVSPTPMGAVPTRQTPVSATTRIGVADRCASSSRIQSERISVAFLEV